MIRVALLDFGGIFTTSPFAIPPSVLEGMGLSSEIALRLAFGPYTEDGDHPWHRLERGEVTLEAAWGDLKERAKIEGYGHDPLSVLGHMAGEDPQREGVVDAVRRLRSRGIRICLVTNNVKEFRDGWRSLIPADELLDEVVDSSEEGVRKPGPEIFRRALARMGGVAAADAVFVDDVPANVTTAQALGIHGVLAGEDRLAAFAEIEAIVAREAAAH